VSTLHDGHETCERPRTRKPVYGILAWVLPLSAILVGYLFLRLCDRKGGEVFALFLPPAWGLLPLLVALCSSPIVRKSPLRILALLLPPPAIFGLMMMLGGNSNSSSGFGGLVYVVIMFLPLVIGLCASPILAIVSLLRRERYPGLAVAVLVLCGIALFWYGLLEAYDRFGEVGALVMIIVPVVLLAIWLVWRFRRKRTATVECQGARIQTKAEDGDISESAPVPAKTPRKVQMPFGLVLGILYILFVWAVGVAAGTWSAYDAVLVLMQWFGDIRTRVMIIVPVVLLTVWLVWRFRRKRTAPVECPGGRIQTKAEDGDISGSAPVPAKTPRKVQMPFGLALGILSIVYSLFVWALGVLAWSETGSGGDKPALLALLLFGGSGTIVQGVLSAIVAIRSLKNQVSILRRWSPLRSLIFCHLGLFSSLLVLSLPLDPDISEFVGWYVLHLLIPYVAILLIMICLRRKWFIAASEGKARNNDGF